MFDITLAKQILTNASGYEHLISIFESIRTQPEKEVRVNFKDCEQIDANLCAVLGSLFDQLLKEGFKLWLGFPKDNLVRHALSRNNFFSAFDPETFPLDPENFIEYRKFKPGEMEAFKTYLDNQLMKKQKFPKHTYLVGKRIRESILEIFVNAETHGKCSYIYSCGEYHENGATPILDMTIVDRGFTIPSTVNEYVSRRHWQTYDACGAIRWALVEGNTTKTNEPGGLGFSILMEFLKLNEGEMQIVSGNGMVEFKKGNLYNYTLTKPFEGTIVNMRFNFDDSHKYRLVSEKVDINNLL